VTYGLQGKITEEMFDERLMLYWNNLLEP